ncbi:uncharacterized protein LOC125819408 [Solanum verrucosum]|uniref:uncharacterized protein LOC125819408 n=1 Tax=Solanum verrucosum TaxID=315347 RepID=UPI0020D13491|nr:uncharacterized protein LOC125819408 [Solanum verrucosum]
MVDQLWFSQQKYLNHMSFEGDDGLCREIWKVCSGSSLDVSKAGERVYYFPRLHVEQLEQSSNQELIERLQLSNLPPKILCRVVHIRLLVEHETEEVYAETILLPNQDQNEPTAPDFSPPDTPRPQFQSFCKCLTQSDIKSNWGLFVPQKDAVKCFPPLDMRQEKPSQELIAMDLQGNEWRFKHAYQGQPRRHSLTNGWSTFVTSKKLLAGDLVVFLRDETGKLHVGIRRLSYQRSIGASTFSRQSMEGALAVASHAFATQSLFFVYHKPCYDKSSQFIMSLSKYFEGGNHGCGVGMISRMQHEGEDSSHVRRTNDLDQISSSQGQQTTNLMLEEDQYMQDSEAVLDCAQSTMIDSEIRQQTIGSLNNIHCFAPVEDNGLQLHAAVARENNNEGSIPNDTVSIQAGDEDLDELFKDFDIPDSTNTSLDTIALDLDSEWFRSTLQEQEETITPSQPNASEDHSRRTSSVLEHPTSFQVMSISSNPSQIPYEGPGRGDEQVSWGGYQVARRTLPILSRVVSRYPDSLVNFRVANSILQSVYLEILAELVYFLNNLTIVNLSKDQFNVARQHIWDLKLSGIEIGWLENRLLHIDEVFIMESLRQRRQALTRRMEETFKQLDGELGCIDKELHELSLKVGPNPPMRLHSVLEGLL